jgi:F-type H+-transporting ATPase subunit delta
MAVSAVTMRYVKALFAVAGKSGERPAVLAALEGLDAVIAASAELRATLRNPRVGVAAKRKILDAVGLEKSPQVMRDFADLCLARGRADVIVEAGEEFRRLERESRGVVVATVETVTPLDEAGRAAVRSKLEEVTGKHVELKEELDAAMIGGMRIFVGSTMWDGSVRRRLDDLEQHLAATPA